MRGGRTEDDAGERWHQWLIGILVALAGLLIVATVVGLLDPGGGLLIVRRVLDHRFGFSVTAVSLLMAAGGLRRSRSQPWVAILLTVTALGWLAGLSFVALGPLYGPGDGTSVANRMPAPQGKPYRAIMIQSDWDPIETVLIQSGYGLRTRQWVAACEGEYELKTASWVGPDQLTITLQDDFDPQRNGETFVIRVNPDTGEPQVRTDSDLHCL